MSEEGSATSASNRRRASANAFFFEPEDPFEGRARLACEFRAREEPRGGESDFPKLGARSVDARDVKLERLRERLAVRLLLPRRQRRERASEETLGRAHDRASPRVRRRRGTRVRDGTVVGESSPRADACRRGGDAVAVANVGRTRKDAEGRPETSETSETSVRVQSVRDVHLAREPREEARKRVDRLDGILRRRASSRGEASARPLDAALTSRQRRHRR